MIGTEQANFSLIFNLRCSANECLYVQNNFSKTLVTLFLLGHIQIHCNCNCTVSVNSPMKNTVVIVIACTKSKKVLQKITIKMLVLKSFA